jgi:hypothetical protein
LKKSLKNEEQKQKGLVKKFEKILSNFQEDINQLKEKERVENPNGSLIKFGEFNNSFITNIQGNFP